ncbi:hypothetical protein GGS21DRAFT_115021 [Xylaria nigripes]|nr:hypothetical protein GGS21DRAFT_115021 [Xylaria nigripes]
MPQGRSPTRGPKTNAGETTGTSNSGIISRVFGSLRGPSHDSDAAAKGKQDTSWIQTYQITHSPDRPVHDVREQVRNRDSRELLDQLMKIREMNKAKTNARAARSRTVSGGRSNQGRHDEPGRRGGNGSSSRSRPRAPGGRADSVPDTRERSHADRKPPTNQFSSQGSGSNRDETVTIRVGIKMSKDDIDGSGATTKGAGAGAYNHSSRSQPAPHAPVRSFTTPSSLRPEPLFSSSAQKEAPQRRQTRPSYQTQRAPQRPTIIHQSTKKQPPSAPPPQPPSANLTRLNTRARAACESVTSLYIDTDQDSPPGLMQNSSPESERAGPLTPILDESDEEYAGDKSRRRGPQASQCRLCRDPLLTAEDKSRNLCSECHTYAIPYSPPSTHASSFTSQISDDAIEVDVAEAKKLPEMVRYVKGESTMKISNPNGSDQSVDRIRLTEVLPSPLKRKKSDEIVTARVLDRNHWGEFHLQAVPANRKHARREPPSENAATSTKRAPASLPGGGSSAKSDTHIGFQLADLRTSAPKSAPGASSQETLGPVLLPKTYCPVPPVPKQNNASSGASRGASRSGSRVTEAMTSSGGRTSSSSRGRREKTGTHKTNASTHSGGVPKSPRHSRSRHQAAPSHPKREAVRDTSAQPEPLRVSKSSSKTSTERAAATAAAADANIERIRRDTTSEIDSIIECYRQLGRREGKREKGKVDFAASYYMQTDDDFEKRSRGFI